MNQFPEDLACLNIGSFRDARIKVPDYPGSPRSWASLRDKQLSTLAADFLDEKIVSTLS